MVMSVGTKAQIGSGTNGSAAGGTNPWLIAVIVSVATFMEVLDTNADRGHLEPARIRRLNLV